MNIRISQNKIEPFLNNYFKHLWFKLFIIQEILWISYCYIQHCYLQHRYLLISILLSFLLIPISFITPKLLHKENRKFIAQFYDKKNGEFNSNKKITKAITVICNLKKFNGPTFGALTLNSNSLIFVPFKENLNNEKFIIDDIKNPNVHISVVNLQHSWINKVFFKGDLYCLDLKWDGKNVVLQMPKDELTKIQTPLGY
ncbi:hypothetical protein G9F71_006620 [Clostridium sp. FP2]|uniref:hypothetical protein n=1 Tax=Clostridium sp. FP2 TaxID=2724481 RepID=UPI0013E94E86|nr:hypothetical protein [Clostridium sp. FP2]MBZ9622523.1 hypothetical protein [Clostridium sp. FP2]